MNNMMRSYNMIWGVPEGLEAGKYTIEFNPLDTAKIIKGNGITGRYSHTLYQESGSLQWKLGLAQEYPSTKHLTNRIKQLSEQVRTLQSIADKAIENGNKEKE